MTHEEIKKKLFENGTIGLDLSPGHELELEAFLAIVELEEEIKKLKGESNGNN